VYVADVPVAEVRAAEGGLEVLVQGAPVAGPADARIVLTDGAEVRVRRVVNYLSPEHPALERFVSVGASLSMGAQSGAPTRHGQFFAPSAQMSRALGAYHPLPWLVEGVFPPMTVADVGPPPGCDVPDLGDYATAAGLRLVQNLRDPETGVVSYRRSRGTPDLAPYNVAVAGSRVGDLERGANADDLVQAIAAGMVLDLDARFGVAPTINQLDVMDGLSPTLIVSSDLYGNDIVAGILQADTIDPTTMTPEDTLREDLVRVIDRLAATGALVFVPNLPRPTLLPATTSRREAELRTARERAVQQGRDPDLAEAETAADIDARIQVILARWERAEADLRAAASRHDNVVVVDIAAVTDALGSAPPTYGGQQLGLGMFQGLLTLDGLHFSDVGYGYLAQEFLIAISAETGVDYEPIDFEALVASDLHSPAALAAQGLAGCESR
jgi:hypothetical protein